MKTITKSFAMAMMFLPAFMACGMGSTGSPTMGSQPSTLNHQPPTIPTFNADSAYSYVAAQAAFGPRVPNTEAHWQCAAFLTRQLERLGAEVTRQEATLTAWNGTPLRACNIIGAYRPELKKRVLLCAHWDSRPYADNDPDERNHRTPIMGINDGASGVGVMIEIARQLQMKSTEIGIDLICFDLEDYGTPQWYEGKHDENSWCLGSQYWSHQPHVEGYNARFGILLDMVGNANARFYKEYFSQRMAGNVVSKVWKKAHNSGYGVYFPKEDGGAITDDHIPVNQIARIPCIDIIPEYENCEASSFGPIWHTINDNISNIDKNTLKAVGQVLMEVIYNEK